MKKLTKEQTKEYQKQHNAIYQKIAGLRQSGRSGPGAAAEMADYRKALTKLREKYHGKPREEEESPYGQLGRVARAPRPIRGNW